MSTKPMITHFRPSYLSDEIDVLAAWPQLCMLCLLTGYIDAVMFTATYVWAGFQTGNTTQLAVSIARTFSPGNIKPYERGIQTIDAQSFCSLLSFCLGCFLARFCPKSISFKSRSYAAISVFFQALLTLGAAIAIRFARQSDFADSRGDTSWTNGAGYVAIGLLSASMGVQAALGSKMGSPFATTVVITSVYVALFNDAQLFKPSLVPTREQKISAVLACFIGGLFARAVHGQIGAANALFIAAALRFLASFSWLVAKGKARENKQKVDVKPSKM